MSTALPVDAVDVDQPQVRLVDERRGLQGVADAFPSQITSGDSLQLGVDERQQLVERGLVAATPGVEQSGCVGGVWQGGAKFTPVFPSFTV